MRRGQRTSVTNCLLAESKVLCLSRCFRKCLAFLRFQKHDLALDIPVTWVPLATELRDGSRDFPVLRPTDTVKFLARSGNISKLVGDVDMDGIGDSLLEFWRRYSQTNGDHQVFSAVASGKISLSRSFPIFVHGDEGRGFKRQGIMLISFQGALGRGSRPFQQRHVIKTARKLRMGLNMAGSSFTTRFLYAAAPKRFYASSPDTWLAISF